jgi:hypothetical protein
MTRKIQHNLKVLQQIQRIWTRKCPSRCHLYSNYRVPSKYRQNGTSDFACTSNMCSTGCRLIPSHTLAVTSPKRMSASPPPLQLTATANSDADEGGVGACSYLYQAVSTLKLAPHHWLLIGSQSHVVCKCVRRWWSLQAGNTEQGAALREAGRETMASCSVGNSYNKNKLKGRKTKVKKNSKLWWQWIKLYICHLKKNPRAIKNTCYWSPKQQEKWMYLCS